MTYFSILPSGTQELNYTWEHTLKGKHEGSCILMWVLKLGKTDTKLKIETHTWQQNKQDKMNKNGNLGSGFFCHYMPVKKVCSMACVVLFVLFCRTNRKHIFTIFTHDMEIRYYNLERKVSHGFHIFWVEGRSTQNFRKGFRIGWRSRSWF